MLSPIADNRCICGFAFGYVGIPIIVGASHIPKTLGKIALIFIGGR